MVVSVVITNHNYGRFLAEAIDSVLDQSYEDCEVIVVDDGSTDDSREVLSRYGTKITAMLTENEGQVAALNTGLARASGSIVCLLDADDRFRPTKISKVVAAFAASPDAQLVYHQIQPVDEAATTPVGKPVPRAVWSGDIRKRVERTGGWWPRPTTSAFSFRRTYLERVLPIPTDGERLWPDTYLSGPAPFAGPVVGIDEPLSLLRLHGANSWSVGRLAGRDDRGGRVEQRLRQYEVEFDALRALLAQLGIPAAISLSDHPRHRQYLYAAGRSGTRASVAMRFLGSASIPPAMRWREAARVLAGRW